MNKDLIKLIVATSVVTTTLFLSSRAEAWTETALAAHELTQVAPSENSNDFYQVGKCYLFLPRLDAFVYGKISKLTDHEIVFTDKNLVYSQKISLILYDSHMTVEQKDKAMLEELNHQKAVLNDFMSGKMKLPNTYTTTETAYSRAEMTAIQTECRK